MYACYPYPDNYARMLGRIIEHNPPLRYSFRLEAEVDSDKYRQVRSFEKLRYCNWKKGDEVDNCGLFFSFGVRGALSVITCIRDSPICL